MRAPLSIQSLRRAAHRIAGHEMIRNFREHAANERTFLAWVRTAIAVMAFGFLIERFDLLLKTAGLFPNLSARKTPGLNLGTVAGISSIVLGTIMFGLAMIRYVRTARDIESADERAGTGARFDIALASLMSLIGVSLFFYLSHAVATVP